MLLFDFKGELFGYRLAANKNLSCAIRVFFNFAYHSTQCNFKRAIMCEHVSLACRFAVFFKLLCARFVLCGGNQVGKRISLIKVFNLKCKFFIIFLPECKLGGLVKLDLNVDVFLVNSAVFGKSYF